MPPPNRNRKMTEHEPIGKWMRRIMQPGETLAPRHDMRMCVVVSSEVIDLIDALEAKLEAVGRDLSNATIFLSERDEKIKRQAEQITRLETSRASLRVALAAAQEE